VTFELPNKDAKLTLLDDYNYVVKMTLGAKMHEVNLIPDTMRSETIIVSKKCTSCKSANEKWAPNHSPRHEGSMTLDYSSQLKPQ
jgi:hypothetical protein